MNPVVLRADASLGFWMRWKTKAVRSFRKRGVFGSVAFAAALAKRRLSVRLILYRFSNPWYRYLDKRFDRRLAVDTAGIVKLPEHDSDPRFKSCSHYEPIPHSLFFRALRQIPVDYSKFVFVDFGCGKGKALVLATELPFQRIIGVERSSTLIQVAEDNLRSRLRATGRQKSFEVVCMDAREYRLPEEPAIYYFYSPFREEAMRKVLENLRRSLAATPRETYVVYACPLERNLFDQSGFLKPIKQTYWCSIYRGPEA